jgi:hypothetical protein
LPPVGPKLITNRPQSPTCRRISLSLSNSNERFIGYAQAPNCNLGRFCRKWTASQKLSNLFDKLKKLLDIELRQMYF